MRERLLGTSVGYEMFRRVVGAERHMRIVLADYVRPQAGERVLDVGCGPADLAALLPEHVTYLGVDHNHSYVASARRRGVEVVEADVADLAELGHPPFDVVAAIGLLHHLDDDQAEQLLRDCSGMLRPGGRIITVDPVNHSGQRMVSKSIMALDRGKWIRDEAGYRRLTESALGDARSEVRRDLVWFPYAHCIVEGRATGDR